MDLKEKIDKILKELDAKESTFYTWITRYGDFLEKIGAVKFARSTEKQRRIEDIDVEKFIAFIKRRDLQRMERAHEIELLIEEIESFFGGSPPAVRPRRSRTRVKAELADIEINVHTFIPILPSNIADVLLTAFFRICGVHGGIKETDVIRERVALSVFILPTDKPVVKSPSRLFSVLADAVEKIKFLFSCWTHRKPSTCKFIIAFWDYFPDTEESRKLFIETLASVADKSGKVKEDVVVTNSLLVFKLFSTVMVSPLEVETLLTERKVSVIPAKSLIEFPRR